MFRNGRATHSTILRGPSFLRTSGSAPGYSKVGWAARGPRRSKPTWTVSGIFMSMAAAQNRSSSGMGYALPLGNTPRLTPFRPSFAQCCQLGDGVVDVGPRDDAEPDQTVARDRTVFLPQPVVVGADRGAVDVIVGERAPEAGPHLHVGKEHLGLEAVDVLLAQALLRRPHPGRVVDGHPEGLPRLVVPPGPEIEEGRGIGRPGPRR